MACFHIEVEVRISKSSNLCIISDVILTEVTEGMPCTEGPEETAPVGSYTCRLVTSAVHCTVHNDHCTEGPEETAPVGSYTCRLVTCSENTQSGNGRFLAYIPWKNEPTLVWVGSARPPPFTTFNITYKVAVYAPAEWADTLTLFHLYQYMYSNLWLKPQKPKRNCTFMNSASVQLLKHSAPEAHCK